MQTGHRQKEGKIKGKGLQTGQGKRSCARSSCGVSYV